MNPIPCHRARVSFELYLDGGLSQEDCEVLESHLFECAACASVIGDDVLLGEALEETLRAGGAEPMQPASRFGSRRSLRAAAAAVLLMLAGVGIGHLTTRGVGGGTPSSEPGRAPGGGAGDAVAQGDLVPLSEMAEDPWVGLASFTDADLMDAEREGLQSRGERLEWRLRRSEAQLDLVRPLLEEVATPRRVVARLSDRIRQSPPVQPGRPAREDGERMRDPVRGAAALLWRDPQAAFGPVSEWLKSAQTPFERRAAVKLLALLRIAEAHDLLEAEVREGPAREAALDGLVALRDPRSHDLFLSLMEDQALPLDPTRIKAAGGLHRLGDPRGLEFLLAAFRSHPGLGPNQALRKRILFRTLANPSHETAAVLPEMIEGVRLERPDRAAIVELLTLSGMSDNDPALVPLVGSGVGDHERVRGERGLIEKP